MLAPGFTCICIDVEVPWGSADGEHKSTWHCFASKHIHRCSWSRHWGSLATMFGIAASTVVKLVLYWTLDIRHIRKIYLALALMYEFVSNQLRCVITRPVYVKQKMFYKKNIFWFYIIFNVDKCFKTIMYYYYLLTLFKTQRVNSANCPTHNTKLIL